MADRQDLTQHEYKSRREWKEGRADHTESSSNLKYSRNGHD